MKCLVSLFLRTVSCSLRPGVELINMPTRLYSLVVRASVYQAENLGSNMVQSSRQAKDLKIGSLLKTVFTSSCLTFCIEGDNVLLSAYTFVW